MTRLVSLIAIAASCAAPAAAQSGIQWLSSPREGIQQARQSKRPLMFYTSGRSQDRPNLDSHKRTFAHPEVSRLARRFVAVKLGTDSEADELTRRWGTAGWTLVFSDADGNKIDDIVPMNPDLTAQKMFAVFDQHRTRLFVSDVQPKLESADTPPRELRAALKMVDEFLMLAADQSLIRMLDREKLDPAVKRECIDLLARLSTPAAARDLLERAPRDKAAADALPRLTPQAALALLDALGGEDRVRHLLAYKALTRIAKIKDPRVDKFWEGEFGRLQREEIQRVTDAARAEAARWSRQNEYR